MVLCNSGWLRRFGACLALGLGLAAPVVAEEPVGYEAERAALMALLENRDTDLFELDFKPLELDRIILKDGLGDQEVFHYLTFRLRNRVSDDAEYLSQHATVYNEVLDSIVEEYAGTSKVTQGGAGLVVDDVEALEDKRLATILEREDLKVGTRVVNLSALVTDEHGTRFRLFDPVPGQGPQERFAFDNRGVVVNPGNFYERVRKAVEEEKRQRFYTTHEINGREIPPFDPNLPSTYDDGYGMAQGEILGILVFDRFNVYGNHFTITIQGLTNKLRMRWPEELPDGRVEDYFNATVLRRVYQMDVSRPGDEYFRELDKFTTTRSGWAWVETFQRIKQRKAIAYGRYFLENIMLEKESTKQGQYDTLDDQGKASTATTDVPVLHDEGVKAEMWEYYNKLRAEWPTIYDGKIASHQAHSQEVLAPYQAPEDELTYTAEELERLQAERAAWQDVLRQHDQALKARRDGLDEALIDWQSKTSN
jgi:hypothetical protein